jgi:eukaryotic-like serine/threonine-protein kinase
LAGSSDVHQTIHRGALMNEWELITSLLAEATELPAGQRRTWLLAAEQSERVKQAVLRLLDAWEAEPDFLEIEAPPPQTIGRWRIGREIGAGGMGRVYEAFFSEGEMERRVAIKVMGGQRFAPERIEAFLRERAILARLEHPGIARLYDTGTTAQGFPYFAMEFVEGQALDVYIQARQPSLRERVHLFVAICQAVAFAHHHLVVHGDLKPSNILVTKDGDPRLLDFGAGSILQAGAAEPMAMLTPQHASPEQLEGKPLTPASDVYQLGLLLHKFLPAPPEDLARLIAKCREGDPLRRYPAADALEAELRRWLDYLPLLVMPSSWPYRSRKSLRRHPVVAGVAAALVLGSATTAWQANRALHNEQRALHQFEETRRFSRQMLAKIARLPVAERKQIVQSTVDLLRTVEQTGERDPVVLLELAYAWRELAALQGLPTTANLGESEAAAQSYARAIALAERARPFNERGALIVLSRYYAEAARVSVVRNEEAALEGQVRKLQATAQALQALGPSSDLALAYSELAYFRSLTNRPAAMLLYRNSIEQFNQAPSADLAQKAFALKRWGALLLADKQLAEGKQRYEAALAIERQLKTDPFALSFTLSDLGLAERLEGRYTEALAHYEEALQIREAAYRADTSNIRAITGLASTLMYLAWVNADAGRMNEAVEFGRRSVELRKRADLPPSSGQSSRSKLMLGHLELAGLLRKQNAKEHSAEIRILIDAVRVALKRDPDKALEAQMRDFQEADQ